jgi:phage tail-like protein
MTGKKLREYRFKNESQWNACLFSQADRDSLCPDRGFRPFPPYAGEPIRYESPGAQAPGVLRTGEILWSDNTGTLHRFSTGDVTSEGFPAPPSIARASRVVSIAGGLWAKSAQSESLECYDEETLTRLLTVDLPNSRIIDIAGEGRGPLLVLVERDGELQCIRISCAGHEVDTIPISFTGISQAKAFIFLRRSQKFVVLAGKRQPSLYWFPAEGGEPVFSKPVATLLPCFKADLLGSDSNERIVVAGSDESASARSALVLVLDADGNRLGQVSLAAPATGIAATRHSLIVADARGLLRYAAADVVPNEAAEVQCMLLTPLLQSLDSEGGPPWLRVDASAILPEGTTLEISYAATDKQEDRERLKAITEDDRLPSSQRIQQLLSDPDLTWSKTLFHGSDREPTGSDAPRSAPLFDVRERCLWVCMTLTAARGARLPAVTEFAVLYPGRSLIENLPTPYRRAAAQPSDFLRSLVGVLEATTQDLDSRIAALSSHIHPATATGPWMDYIARWLGLPWDDALTDAQKRAILLRAADLARERGTRAGLEVLLECLMPGAPRRFRVTDTTGDFGFAVVGGDRCAGSALPAMLGGFTRWHAELDSATVLGYTRLPCAGQVDDGAQRLAGKIRIEVAGAKEREAWEPWLLALITEMVPLTARVDLRWVSARVLRGDRLDDTLRLEPPPDPHLGSDAVTGLARLPQQRRTRLAGSAPTLGTSLR